MTRVLTVLPDFPWPDSTGLHLRMMGNLRAVHALGFESHVAWFATPERTEESVDPSVLDDIAESVTCLGPRVEQHDISVARRIASKFSFVATGLAGWPREPYPYSMRYDVADGREQLSELVWFLKPDAVVLPSQLIHWEADLVGVRVIADAADVLTDVTERLARTSDGGLIHRLGLWANHLACRRQERRHAGRVDEIWATSQAEADRFRELAPDAHVVVVPNTVAAADAAGETADGTADPAEAAASAATPERVAVSFGMLATWSYRPNLDAAHRLIDQIASRVIAAVPEARLVLAGADLPDELQQRIADHPGMEYLGRLDDVQDFYDAIDVAAIPLTVRGGVPLKLAEALARGRAVVASEELVDGLDLESGRDVMVAPDDGAFASCIVELAASPQRRQELVRNGRAAHRRAFSEQQIVDAVREHSVIGG